MKVAIVGTRDYPDLEQVRRFVRKLPAGTIVVSGGARGVDSAAVEEAIRIGLPEPVVIDPEKDPDGRWVDRNAGLRRNSEIVRQADSTVAFWDGKSGGTKDTIGKTLAARKPLQVFFPR